MPFLALSAIWFALDDPRQVWLPAVFLALYFGFFTATGLHGCKVGFGKRGDANLGFDHARDVEFVRQVTEAIGPDNGPPPTNVNSMR